VVSATLVLAAVPLGQRWLLLAVLAGGVLLTGLMVQSGRWRAAAVLSLIVLALVGEQQMSPLRMELRTPLDEGMVMDMPITTPRASIAQSGDDLKARNMVLCRFPEVHMVVGKAGRADTPFDPAPLDMIETMIEFRPHNWWPKRRLLQSDAARQAHAVWRALCDEKLIAAPTDAAAYPVLIAEAVDAGLLRFDAIQREVCHQEIQQFYHTLSAGLAQQLVTRVVEMQSAARRMTRSLTPGELIALQQALAAERVSELALGPTDELIGELSENVVARLKSDDLLPESAAAPLNAAAVARSLRSRYERMWKEFVPELNSEASRRAPPLWTRIISEELIARSAVLDLRLAAVLRQAYAARYAPPKPHHTVVDSLRESPPLAERADDNPAEHHHGLGPPGELPLIDPHPAFDAMQRRLAQEFAASLALRSHDAESLAGFGGEMDRALQMPGWTNVWTKPIQNRVDMLATGVNAEVGVRVLGRDLDAVVRASEDIAAALRELPGAADVVADPIRGKGYLRITPNSERAAALGLSLSAVKETIETALAGRVVAHELHGRERLPVRVRLVADDVLDEETLRRLPIPLGAAGAPRNVDLNSHDTDGSRIRKNSGDGTAPRILTNSATKPATVTLDSVATVAVTEGPATIKSENGWLRNYVRLNVRDRDVLEFVEEAKRVVAGQVALPPGVFLEWTGQFEHSLAARRKLLWLMPVVLALILLLLYATYRDWADALLMVLVVPGALAGGVLCQWLFGYPFSIAVGMGYIACFGMAAATGIVMLVYLREAVTQAGGLERITLPELREAVLAGAVHRLRPKLLTEATTILGLAPMLWSSGVGAEVIRPMAAPVLGGILIADEVIDLLLPILFYYVRRRRWRRLHPLEPSVVETSSPAAALAPT
jgi:Cu(I)/Ag(I) efflux system membrane protein CusA/SilA